MGCGCKKNKPKKPAANTTNTKPATPPPVKK